ncbi:hypothetical protein [Kordia sp.]|uniref:hypothetical protein n=1 Tax=Kordia sp. TaxID=1965332 RepID=UPI003D6B5FE5
MKKKSLKNLAIKKITVSKINGGATNAGQGVLSIGKNCTQPTKCESIVNCSDGIFCNDHGVSSDNS